MGKVASKQQDLIGDENSNQVSCKNYGPLAGQPGELDRKSSLAEQSKLTFTRAKGVDGLRRVETTTTILDDLFECCSDCCPTADVGSPRDCQDRCRPRLGSTCCAACRQGCRLDGAKSRMLLAWNENGIENDDNNNNDNNTDRETDESKGGRPRLTGRTTLIERDRERKGRAINGKRGSKVLAEQASHQQQEQRPPTLLDGPAASLSVEGKGSPLERLTFTKRRRQRRPSPGSSGASSMGSPAPDYAIRQSEVGLSIKANSHSSDASGDAQACDEQDTSSSQSSSSSSSSAGSTRLVAVENQRRQQLHCSELKQNSLANLVPPNNNNNNDISSSLPPKTTNLTSPPEDLNTWNGISVKFGRMSRREQRLVASDGPRGRHHQPGQRTSHVQRRTSCFCLLITTLLRQLFPIVDGFKGYNLRQDLLNEMVAGVTIAIMHIPQGMAYGLLAGVDPIHGLNVSFVPVLVMAFMSRSRHVSYGTFAVISMLLANTVDSVRLAFRQQQQQVDSPVNLTSQTRILSEAVVKPATGSQTASQAALVLTNNHQPADQAQRILRNLLLVQAQQQQQHQVSPDYTSDASSLVEPATNEANLFGSLVGSPSAQATSNYLEMPTNIEILTCVCLVCGLIHVTMCLMRLGVLSLMFSDQLVSSFTTASAFHVLTSQLAGLFDLSLAPIPEETFKLFRTWWSFGRALLGSFSSPQQVVLVDSPQEGNVNHATGLLSVASIVFLLLVKQLVEPTIRRKFKAFTCLPSELVLMALVTLSSWYWSFSSHYNIRIIGQVPSGLPAAQLPRLDLVPLVMRDSLTIALVSFAMNLSLAQVYAKRYRYKLDSNQELFALGTANVVASFFSCFPCASSLSRSAVQSNFNVRSQVCSLVSCSIVVVIICYFTSALYDLPRSTLSCIIVVALKGVLVQVRDFYDNWSLSKLDALVWMTTFMSVIMFGVTYGLILGIISSLFMIFFRLLTPNYSLLGRLPGTDIFVDLDAFVDCKPIERIQIFRFNSALCYLNRQMLKSIIEKLLPDVYKPQGLHALCSQLYHNHRLDHHYSWHSSSSESSFDGCQHTNSVEFLIIDCSALAYCDCSGVAALVEIVEELEEHRLPVYLAACPLKLIEAIERMNKTRIMDRNIYPTISEAVKRARYLRDLAAAAPTAADGELGAGKGGGQLTGVSLAN